jgi:PAS domain S-box-containing protein
VADKPVKPDEPGNRAGLHRTDTASLEMSDGYQSGSQLSIDAGSPHGNDKDSVLSSGRSPGAPAYQKDDFDFSNRPDLLTSIMETSPVGIVFVNANGHIVFANKKAEAILGLTRSEIFNRSYDDLKWKVTDFNGGPFPNHELSFHRVMETKQPVTNVRHAIEWPNGKRVLLSINAAPLFDADRTILGMVASLDDITERVQANEKLRACDLRFRNIVESSPMGIHMYELDADDRLVFVGANQAADEILGVDNEQFVGKTIEEAFPPAVETEIPYRYRRAAEAGEHWKTESIDYHHGKIRGAYEVHAFQTAPRQMAALFLDITNRKQAETRERKHAEEFAFLANSAMSLVEFPFEGDFDRYIAESLLQMVDTALIMVTRYDEKSDSLTPTSLVGVGDVVSQIQKLLGRSPQSMSVPLYKELRQRLMSGRLIRVQAGIHETSGGLVPKETAAEVEALLKMEALYSMGLFRKGKLLGHVAIFSFKEGESLNISLIEAFIGQVSVVLERRYAEQERAELEEQLRHAQKLEAIGTLAGGVAHDFNNLLTSMLGQTYLLKSKTSPHSPVWESLDIIESAGHRAAELTQQLLGFARKGKMRNVSIDLGDTIKDVVALLKHTVDKRIGIYFETPQNMPKVVGDPGQLHQVFVNLAVNARDAMPEGGKIQFAMEVVNAEGLISVASGEKNPNLKAQFLLTSVSDTGTGIREDCVDRIFEPFFTTKEQGKGTGMGLAVAYGIVRAHGGWIDVTTKEGGGTTFYVYLPADDQATTSAEDQPSQRPSLGKGSILVVDDEELVRKTLGEMLRSFGYQVTCVENGRKALDYLAEHQSEVDLILLDMIMPDMDGRSCYKAIRNQGCDVQVVIITGHSPDQVTQNLLDQGVLGIIEKPFDMNRLSQIIAQALQR